jgi:hypothetical protein
LDGNAGKFAVDACKKQSKTSVGFFKHGVRNQATTDELYQHLQLFRRPGRQLAEHNKRKKAEYQNSIFPEMKGLTFEC